MARCRDRRGSRRTGLRGESLLRIPPLHARPPGDAPDNSTKQIELFDSRARVPCEEGARLLRRADFGGYSATPMTDRNIGPQSNTKVDIYLQVQERQGPRHGHAAALRAHPRLAAGQGRRHPRVHRRGHDRPHAEGRGRAHQARHGLRRRRRAPPDRLRSNTNGQRMEETFEIKVRNHKDAAGQGHRAGEPLSLEPVDCSSSPRRPRRRTRGRSNSRCVPRTARPSSPTGCATPGETKGTHPFMFAKGTDPTTNMKGCVPSF